MEKIKRYDPKYRPYTSAMIEDDLGGFVKYEDYQVIKIENTKLKHDIGSFLNIITPEQMKEFDRIN